MPLTQIETETLAALRSAARKYAQEEIDWEERKFQLVLKMVEYNMPISALDTIIDYAEQVIEQMKAKMK